MGISCPAFDSKQGDGFVSSLVAEWTVARGLRPVRFSSSNKILRFVPCSMYAFLVSLEKKARNERVE